MTIPSLYLAICTSTPTHPLFFQQIFSQKLSMTLEKAELARWWRTLWKRLFQMSSKRHRFINKSFWKNIWTLFSDSFPSSKNKNNFDMEQLSKFSELNYFNLNSAMKIAPNRTNWCLQYMDQTIQTKGQTKHKQEMGDSDRQLSK